MSGTVFVAVVFDKSPLAIVGASSVLDEPPQWLHAQQLPTPRPTLSLLLAVWNFHDALKGIAEYNYS